MGRMVKTGMRDPVPVTLLSGFLGAGKTTLLKRILEQSHKPAPLKGKANPPRALKVAVLVNDMAALNIDENLVRGTKLLQQEEKLVELHNGCICCTLREDLVKALADLAAEGTFDAIVVESTGVSEPQEVAETFTYELHNHQGAPVAEEEKVVRKALRGASVLNDVAKLDTCVTVVDCASFAQNAQTSLELGEKWRDSSEQGDQRGVAPLLISQIEFADVVVLNKTDLVSEEEAASVEAAVKALNPVAEVVRSQRAEVPLERVLRTGLFSMEKASEAPGWLKVMRGEPVVPETEVYGIASFVYAARAPFHPKRLLMFLDRYFLLCWNAYYDQASGAQGQAGQDPENPQAGEPLQIGQEAQAEQRAEEEREQREREREAARRVEAARRDFGGKILRGKGFVWLAGRDQLCGNWSNAGPRGEITCGGPWMHMYPKSEWPEEGSDAYQSVMKDFDGPVLKDRRQEIVFIGQGMDQRKITAALDACLVTEEDTRGRRGVSGDEEHGWKIGVNYLEDPIPHWERYEALLPGFSQFLAAAGGVQVEYRDGDTQGTLRDARDRTD